MKKCPKCQLIKELSEFYKDNKKKDGLKSWCTMCHLEDSRKRESKYNETRKNWRLNNKEKSKENKKQYYTENSKKILEQNKNWRQTFKGRLSSYIKGAKNRNIEWKLTEEEFLSFWNQKCFYCGDITETIGIDRKNNEPYYSIDNTVSCCSVCNKMKMDLSFELFTKKIKQIRSYKSLYIGIDNYHNIFGTYDVFSFQDIKNLLHNKLIAHRH